MKLRGLLSAVILFVFFGCVQAGHIPVQVAQNVALNFFKLNAPAYTDRSILSAELKYTRTEANNTVDYYVFDIKPSGFVIVTADDNLEPVIGYSTESTFYTGGNHVGVKDWMDIAATKISHALKQRATADDHIAHLWASYINGVSPGYQKGSIVGPLLTTTWNQEPYYNQACPYNSTDQMNCLAGCVATAMAQIMKFWNFPPAGTGSYSYNDGFPAFTNNYGILSANFAETVYSWPNMANYINSSNSAVATLIYQCGISVAMDYGDDKQGGSGAPVLRVDAGPSRPCAQSAYSTYFSYNADSLKGVLAKDYSTGAWTSLLEAEINAGRPVQYEGQDPTKGGHTWICDGYDANAMFHMNWGWGGYDNGFFSLGNLSAAGANFSTSEAALIGIMPGTYKSQGTTGVSNVALPSFRLYPNPATEHVSVEFEGANNGPVHFSIYNMAGQQVMKAEGASTSGINSHTINVGELNNGVYILEVESNGSLNRQKFIVAK